MGSPYLDVSVLNRRGQSANCIQCLSSDQCIEGALFGTADWTGVPSDEAPCRASADQFFPTSTKSSLSCEVWLGQLVVLFDGKGVNLKDMNRSIVNYEGAPSIDVGRLAVAEGEAASKAAENPAPTSRMPSRCSESTTGT